MEENGHLKYADVYMKIILKWCKNVEGCPLTQPAYDRDAWWNIANRIITVSKGGEFWTVVFCSAILVLHGVIWLVRYFVKYLT